MLWCSGIPHVRCACYHTYNLERYIRSDDRKLQLGNYLGAIQNWVALQQKLADPLSQPADGGDSVHKILFSIVGLHAITMPQDPKVLKRERRESLACLLACGVGPGGSLDPAKQQATLFFQEEVGAATGFLLIAKMKAESSCVEKVPEHAELAWYFNTLTGVGKLQRMTTWKVGKLSIWV